LTRVCPQPHKPVVLAFSTPHAAATSSGEDRDAVPTAAATAAPMFYPTNTENGRRIGFAEEVDKEADMFSQRLYCGESQMEQSFGNP